MSSNWTTDPEDPHCGLRCAGLTGSTVQWECKSCRRCLKVVRAIAEGGATGRERGGEMGLGLTWIDAWLESHHRRAWGAVIFLLVDALERERETDRWEDDGGIT